MWWICACALPCHQQAFIMNFSKKEFIFWLERMLINFINYICISFKCDWVYYRICRKFQLKIRLCRFIFFSFILSFCTCVILAVCDTGFTLQPKWYKYFFFFLCVISTGNKVCRDIYIYICEQAFPNFLLDLIAYIHYENVILSNQLSIFLVDKTSNSG